MAYKGVAAVLAGLIAATPVAAQESDAVAPVAEDAPPAPIEGVAASFRAPPRDASGAYLTPNRDLSADETTWHVRVALNVAALGCRGDGEAAIVTGYNAMLARDAAPLAAASAGMAVRYQAKFGAGWQARNDDNMTRLYNFFAQTVAQREFCAEAQAVLDEAGAVDPVDFARFAATALPRLEAPFVAFYARYDGYRSAVAAYDARHTTRIVIATAAPAPMGPAFRNAVP